MDQPTAEDLLTQLERLVGTWSVESRWPGDEPWPRGVRTSFEWRDSGQHLVQRSTFELPRRPRQRIDHRVRRRQQHLVPALHDERGVCRVYEMSIDERE